MPVAAFIPGGLIKSADHNSNYSDIATALTQSLATTGVSTMTGPFKGAPGTVAAPGITFNGAPATGFYLAGTNQIGWAANGSVGATFNSDTSITFSGTISANKGTVPIGAVMDFAGATAPAGWLLCFGQLISTTTYSLLFAALSTTYGSGSGTFGVPDYRGRSGFGQDNMGGSAAGRITVAGGNFDGTVLGNSGGGQNQQLTLSQIPTGITAINAAQSISVGAGGQSIPTSTNPYTGGTASSPGGLNVPSSPGGGIGQATSLTGSNSILVTSNNTSGLSHPILDPAIITNKVIYAGV